MEDGQPQSVGLADPGGVLPMEPQDKRTDELDYERIGHHRPHERAQVGEASCLKGGRQTHVLFERPTTDGRSERRDSHHTQRSELTTHKQDDVAKRRVGRRDIVDGVARDAHGGSGCEERIDEGQVHRIGHREGQHEQRGADGDEDEEARHQEHRRAVGKEDRQATELPHLVLDDPDEQPQHHKREVVEAGGDEQSIIGLWVTDEIVDQDNDPQDKENAEQYQQVTLDT
jgi:hypothetical protein